MNVVRRGFNTKIHNQCLECVMNYTPAWLRLGLEAVYNETLSCNDNDDKFLRTEVDELVKAVGENRFSVDLDHSFRLVFSEWSKTGSFTGGEDNSLHSKRVIEAKYIK